MSVQDLINEISVLNSNDKLKIIQYILKNDEDIYYKSIINETNDVIEEYKNGNIKPMSVSEFMEELESELI